MTQKNLARNAGIALRPTQIAWLNRLAKQWGVSRSAAVQRVIEEHRDNITVVKNRPRK